MATDQEIRDRGIKFLPKQKYLQNPYEFPVEEEAAPVQGGITNTNAFTGSGNSFNQSGNAFGYGSQIEPGGSYGSYDSINYTGGLPGNVQQYGIGRQFEDPSASPTGETYSYKKEVPGFMRIAGGFIPGGNFLLNLAEKRMNANRDQPPGNYKVGGLDESMKGYYDNLAGSGMLFDGPGGLKTLTGKNFTGKGYLEGQMELAKGFGFDTMTEEEIEDEIAKTKANPRKQFEYKQKLEASQMYKTNKAQEKNIENMANLAAAESRRESARQYDPAVHGPTNYGLGSDGNQSYDSGNQGFGTNATSGGPVSNKTGRGRTDYMKGGRAGYFFGGRVNYKTGGRIGFQGGGGQIGGTDDMSGGKGDPDDNREQYGAVGQYSKGPPTSTKDGGDKTFFNDPKTLYKNTQFGFNVPTGLTTTTPYGRLSAILNLNKTIEDEDLEGKVQFDSSIGPINTTTSYDTTIGPTFDASYTQGPVSIGYNNLDGINASYNDGPISVGYNDGQATVNYSKSFAKGGRVSFKNGGLASIL